MFENSAEKVGAHIRKPALSRFVTDNRSSKKRHRQCVIGHISKRRKRAAQPLLQNMQCKTDESLGINAILLERPSDLGSEDDIFGAELQALHHPHKAFPIQRGPRPTQERRSDFIERMMEPA
jgi:hypothetical protein